MPDEPLDVPHEPVAFMNLHTWNRTGVPFDGDPWPETCKEIWNQPKAWKSFGGLGIG